MASGSLLERGAWAIVNYFAVPLIAVIGTAIVWLMLKRRPVPAI